MLSGDSLGQGLSAFNDLYRRKLPALDGRKLYSQASLQARRRSLAASTVWTKTQPAGGLWVASLVTAVNRGVK